jgi:2-keto-3-deoxy-L-rhamnonate aldolase RhmA
MGINQMRTPNIAMIAAACGFDAIYIDLEHNPPRSRLAPRSASRHSASVSPRSPG